MSLETQIQSRLAPVLAGKVFAVMAPEGTQFPLIVWQRISSDAQATHEATADLYQVRVQVTCYVPRASGISAARALREAAVSALEGNWPDGPISVADKSEGFEDDAQVFRADADFYVWSNN